MEDDAWSRHLWEGENDILTAALGPQACLAMANVPIVRGRSAPWPNT